MKIKRAQREVHKIMRELGKSPAEFHPASPPHRRLTCEQLIALAMMFVVFVIVWSYVIWIISDWFQR